MTPRDGLWTAGGEARCFIRLKWYFLATRKIKVEVPFSSSVQRMVGVFFLPRFFREEIFGWEFGGWGVWVI